MDKVAPTTRHKFVHQDRVIYEWDQTISEVNIYIPLPPGVSGRDLDVKISARHVVVGIKGLPPYLDKDLGGGVVSSDCFWTVEDGTLAIQLSKAEAAGLWSGALSGHELPPEALSQDHKQLMIQRFQDEHPGFDFSGAEFNGQVPDPATFLRDLRD